MSDEIYEILCEFKYFDDPVMETCKEVYSLRKRVEELERANDKLLKYGWMEWKKAGKPGDWKESCDE